MPDLFSPLLTVSELTRQIRSNLERQFPSVWVEGEISNLRCPTSGHQYFTLKDGGSQIRTVLFRSQAQGLKFALQDGLEVLVLGRVTVYEPRGDYQLLLDGVEPKGIGVLQLAFQQLKTKLEREGLFADSRKRSLPKFPERIGVVTSPVGAVLRDVLTILHRRWPLAHIMLAPVAVQGKMAAGQIVQGIRMFNEWTPSSEKVDVLIVGRGGGSMEDLWAFNEEPVVKAIAASTVPIVSAVGHETDITLSDLAADCRAPTPSAAAELVVPDEASVRELVRNHRIRSERSLKNLIAFCTVRVQQSQKKLPEPRLIIGQFVQQVDELERQLFQKIKQWFRTVQLMLLHHQSTIWEANPLLAIHREREKLGVLDRKLFQEMDNVLLLRRHNVKLAISQMHQLSPLRVLARGYSIVKDIRSGKVIKKSTEIRIGEKIHATLSEGELICKVEKIHPE